MPTVIATGQCIDGARWEAGFRSHGELFLAQTVVSPIRYSVNDRNEFAIVFEVEDLESYQDILESELTAEAMALDGVIRETIRVFLADREFDLSG